MLKHMKMKLDGDVNRNTNGPHEPADEPDDSQNKSNNGHKYIPEESDIRHLEQNFYRKHVYQPKNGKVVRISDVITEHKLMVLDDKKCTALSKESYDTNIEIVISQDALSGELCFDIVFIHELETFMQTISTRRILATSYATCTHENTCTFNEVYQASATERKAQEPTCNAEPIVATTCVQSRSYRYDSVEKQSGAKSEHEGSGRDGPSARSPGSGDTISHTPGILHVPHKVVYPERDEKHAHFKQHLPERDHGRGRTPFRRHGRENQRYNDNKSWTSDRRPKGTASSNPPESDKVNPPRETRPFYGERYYNTNTYCSETTLDVNVKPRANDKNSRWSQENRGGCKKTNASWSEGDLPRSRQTHTNYRTDPKSVQKIITRKCDSTEKPTELRKVTKDESDQYIHERADVINILKARQNQECNQSVSLSAPREQKPTVIQQPETVDEETTNEKAKKKKRRSSKKNKQPEKLPKSQLEILQRQVDLGQMKSFFSKYRTESLKNLTLSEELYKGTFSAKYKAVYQNESVLLSVFCDQDTSDIAAVDMAHMRKSYFVDCLKDCIRGPGQSLVLMTKYCRLGDLNTFLVQDQARHVVGEMHAQFIVAGLLIGVEYLHRNDIVHGNIKPSKILLNNEGFPVLAGFLKVQAGSEVRDVYTPAYAAPERFRADRGQAVDIFSVGCVAYEIITGRTPFDGGSLEKTKAQIVHPTYRPWYDPELFSYAAELFIDQCLRKKACDRFVLAENQPNLRIHEWFSTLDMSELRRQLIHSPILDAIQLLNNRAMLTWEEKMVNYDWGRVMDHACPDTLFLDD